MLVLPMTRTFVTIVKQMRRNMKKKSKAYKEETRDFDNTCPVCSNKCGDMRHIGIECFYEVDEYVPESEKQIFFKEVDEKSTYWGVTRRYKEGTKDRIVQGEYEEEEVIKIITKQEPVDSIRLLEIPLYRVNCCKGCRHEFLSLFSAWFKAKFVQPLASETEGIREVTLEELEQLKEGRKTNSD
jgi:hypothetical protein